ncbi:MAG: amino acid permease [Candidatus Aenigmarchaeota archaeon]|nr:amino acid permease [Candidatus Aenigmarchaeota archaeon]
MPKLKRALGLLDLTAYGVGIILGAGIYALIGKAAGLAGPSVWISFLIGALLAITTALSYVELGTMFPKAAAEYVYAKNAFKNKLLCFLIGFFPIAVGIIAGSTVALGFGGYLQSLTGIPLAIGALGLIAACGVINFWGIKQSARINIIFTLIELSGLILIILFALYLFLMHQISPINLLEAPNGITGILNAAALIFFAYIGFEDIVNMAEETKNPKKILPKAFLLSILITSLIYIMVSIASVSILPWEILGQSDAPLADVAEIAVPGSSYLLSIIALFATANTVLIILIVETRMIWGMAKAGSLPKVLSVVHKKRKTPWLAILVTTLIAMLFSATTVITTIAQAVDVIVFIIFISVNASLIVLRYKKPKLKRPFKVPLNIGKFPLIPAISIIICLSLMLHLDIIVFLYLGIIVAAGILTYFLKSKL